MVRTSDERMNWDSTDSFRFCHNSVTVRSLSPILTPPHWTTSPSPAGYSSRVVIAPTHATSYGIRT